LNLNSKLKPRVRQIYVYTCHITFGEREIYFSVRENTHYDWSIDLTLASLWRRNNLDLSRISRARARERERKRERKREGEGEKKGEEERKGEDERDRDSGA